MDIDSPIEKNGFFKLLDVLNSYKKLIVLIILIFSTFSLLYGFTAQKIYQAQVLMVSNDEQSSSGSALSSLSQGLGGLAGLTGVGLSDGERKTNIAIAKLNSKRFVASYLSESGLLKSLFPDRVIKDTGEWRENQEPSLEEIKEETDRRFSLRKNKITGLITLTVEHPSPEIAYKWANGIIPKINEKIRKEDSEEGEMNVIFLQKKLDEINLQNIRSVFFALIEKETQKIMLANIRLDYAFKVIDPAIFPESPIKPRKFRVLAIGMLIGIAFGIFIALFLNFLKEERALQPK